MVGFVSTLLFLILFLLWIRFTWVDDSSSVLAFLPHTDDVGCLSLVWLLYSAVKFSTNRACVGYIILRPLFFSGQKGGGLTLRD